MASSNQTDLTNLQPGDKVDYHLLRKHAIKGVTLAAKRSKKDFIKFVKYYNAHVTEINLTVEEKEALKKVHAIWKKLNFKEVSQVSLNQILMKPHVDILCKRLVSMAVGPRPREKQLWTEFMLGMGEWGEQCRGMFAICTEQSYAEEEGSGDGEDSEDVDSCSCSGSEGEDSDW